MDTVWTCLNLHFPNKYNYVYIYKYDFKKKTSKQIQHITCVRPKILESSFNIIQLHQPVFFMTFPSAPDKPPWLTRRELRELRRSDLATKRGLVWRYGWYKVILSCNMYILYIVYDSICILGPKVFVYVCLVVLSYDVYDIFQYVYIHDMPTIWFLYDSTNTFISVRWDNDSQSYGYQDVI